MAQTPDGGTDGVRRDGGEPVDVPLLDALSRHTLVFLQDGQRRSVVIDHEGRTVIVACTDRSVLSQWWRGHPDAPAEPAYVRELPFRQIVGLWAAPGIDLLVDPGPGGGAKVSIAHAREHLGMGPVLPDRDGREPLPFTGFTGGRAGVRVPLLVMLLSVVLIFVGLGQLDWRFAVVGVVGVAAGCLLGRRGFGEVRAAWRASRRLRASERLRRPGA